MKCSSCVYWKYTELIADKYGEGFGHCRLTNEFTFCDRSTCLLFKEGSQVEESKSCGVKW